MKTLRSISFAMLAVVLAQPVIAADSPAPLDDAFRLSIAPFVKNYCLACHDQAKKKGDVDLSVYVNAESVAKDIPRWELVLEQLEEKRMPPAKSSPRPSEDESRRVIAWIESVRKREASRHAGDPGPVSSRRLSNAEYDYTIRDLTGVDLRPTREFPVDPANRSGFDNSAESLTMSPALFKKYLEAARSVANHLVLAPGGIAFAEFPVIADTDRDKYCTRRIIEFYKRQPTKHADYFVAAWRFQHRKALGMPDATLAEIAARAKISPKYLAEVWSTLNEPCSEVGPIAAVQRLWKEIPAPTSGTQNDDTARAGCERLAEFVVELRQRLVPKIPNLTLPEAEDGAQPLVLWKNRQFVAIRRKYVGGLEKLIDTPLKTGTPEARALAVPKDKGDLKRYEADYPRFCSTFPDAFFISERGRMFVEQEDKQNVGRYLSAGFHNQMGYFRDDAPLSELILDEAGRRELDDLWLEFDSVTGAPLRQHQGFIWYERTEPPAFMGTPEFDFARAEDKSATDEAMMARLAETYFAKAKRLNASETTLQAIEDHFRISSDNVRRVEKTRLAAEPKHLEALQEFAERAFRGPLSPVEREDIAAFYRRLRDQDGLSHEDATRDTLVGILLAPRFCYHVYERTEATGIVPLSDYDLASRLSYFLWSSMPDRELLARAAANDLHQPDVLISQARRMLRDDRARGLALEFGGNWLDFRRFEEHNSVDRKRFPSFDDTLRQAMFEEPVRFLMDVFRNDRSVMQLLEAKHTFVNPVLAKHYGMAAPEGERDEWVRVDDAGAYGRGGLLAMAVFLTKNSPGLRTSPVKRGYWVVRRLLGENIPPPPPNVPELPSDESKLGDLTLRQALSAHRADKACAGCHERFDSIGLSYEGFGPIGELRKLDLGGKPVDTLADFPGGVAGDGINGLRAYLLGHRDEEFVDNLCRKLLAYALGRTLIPSDDEVIDAMKTRLKTDGGRFSSLIEGIVTSPQFLNRRVETQKKRDDG